MLKSLYAALGLLLCAGASQAATLPVLTGPTLYKISPYLDFQVGGSSCVDLYGNPESCKGPEGRSTAATWNNNTKLVLTPIGDGSVVKVEIKLVLRTTNIITIPNASSPFNYIMLAGVPPISADQTPAASYAGDFEGLQVTAGTTNANFNLDGNSANNTPDGGRFYMVCSFWGTPPYNAWATFDTDKNDVVNFPNRCWLQNRVNGNLPFRLEGYLVYLSDWTDVSYWLQKQEAAGRVVQIDPVPGP
jgi:hypothetical protein